MIMSHPCTMGTEHRVQQRSKEWFELRRKVLLTASVFCEAVGIGKGKPYDFFMHLLQDVNEEEPEVQNRFTEHGIAMEEIMKELYVLLSGSRIRDSGFWTPHKDSCLKYLIGASPDGIVYDDGEASPPLGLVEFKAPVYKMYSGNRLIGGIPRHYMTQVQGQMAVCGAPWCDFLAVCKNTKEIVLKRVFFHPGYWSNISHTLKLFCHALQVLADTCI
ncbi:uncharacterized protein LOC121380483 [Gigantopelta aegis]|uniref:uncharacterized protein LOC121380483 n=1 Tax=Gigantopelta aegis TaxID=1735272 RepID=UPI001B8874E5|nr:uncharacterized protein LOC121380483 [Gigantopelta aegis]